MKDGHMILEMRSRGQYWSHDQELVTPISILISCGGTSNFWEVEVWKMEYSEASKACALKFLEKFVSSEALPDADQPLPLRSNWPDLLEDELEGECLEMTKRYLSSK